MLEDEFEYEMNVFVANVRKAVAETYYENIGNLAEVRNATGANLLMVAIAYEAVEYVALFLKLGISPDFVDYSGCSAFFYVDYRRGNAPQILKMLLDAGGNLFTRNLKKNSVIETENLNFAKSTELQHVVSDWVDTYYINVVLDTYYIENMMSIYFLDIFFRALPTMKVSLDLLKFQINTLQNSDPVDAKVKRINFALSRLEAMGSVDLTTKAEAAFSREDEPLEKQIRRLVVVLKVAEYEITQRISIMKSVSENVQAARERSIEENKKREQTIERAKEAFRAETAARQLLRDIDADKALQEKKEQRKELKKEREREKKREAKARARERETMSKEDINVDLLTRAERAAREGAERALMGREDVDAERRAVAIIARLSRIQRDKELRDLPSLFVRLRRQQLVSIEKLAVVRRKMILRGSVDALNTAAYQLYLTSKRLYNTQLGRGLDSEFDRTMRAFVDAGDLVIHLTPEDFEAEEVFERDPEAEALVERISRFPGVQYAAR